MIIDAENKLFDAQDLSAGTSSNVVANGAGGDAYNALWLYAKVDKVLSGAATVAINTSDTEDMSGAVTLASLALPAAVGSEAKVKVPAGTKKYIQAVVSGATTGTVSAALVMDVELK